MSHLSAGTMHPGPWHVPYKNLNPEKVALPPRPDISGYVRPPMDEQTFVPNIY